jgi:cell division protein ZapA
MAHVVVTIAGRTYRMACEDGEEAHLQELARLVEEKILSLRSGFGEIGEQRIVIMAALTMADEAAVARRKLEAAENELAFLRSAAENAQQNDAQLQEKVAKALEDASERIERVARDLAQKEEDANEIPLS